MAQITGSSTIDWSTIPLGQVDFAAHIVRVSIRSEEIGNELDNPANYNIVSQTPTLLVVDLVSGGRLRLAGTGMDNFPSFINSLTEFDFTNIATGEVIRYTGLFDGIGNELITSATFGSTGYLEKINGNVTVFPNSTFSGTVTSLMAVIGSDTVTFSGNFRITGNDVVASLTGTVTGISVVSGADTINMTGLSLSIDVVEAALKSAQLATVNDLFSVVGSQMTGNDTITYTNNSGTGMTFFGGAGNDTITISGPNADTLNGGAGNDTLNGGDGADTLTGLAGNDTLNGGAGNDAMDGGAGNDTYVVDSASDTVTESLTGVVGGTDIVQSSAANFTLGANVENLTLTGTDNLNGTGNELNNILTGNSGNNSLDGGTGADKMAGGTGNDFYTADSARDVVTEALNAGTDKVFASLNYTLGANVEDLELTGSANLTGTGNAFANTLTGNSGNNTLIGGLGEDIVNGGAGNDQITMLVTAGNVDTIDAGADTDTLVLSGVVPGDHVVVVDLSLADQVVSIGGTPDDTRVQSNFENLNAAGIGSVVNATGSTGDNSIIGSNGNDNMNGGAGNDTLNGGLGNDTLIGGAGNDTLNGGAGIDTMTGGTGDDTYVVDNPLDVLTENVGEGTDTVNINRSVDLTLAPFTEIENVLLTSTAAIIATG
ncbi:MAG TPA: calcium-binding protein, partial [Nitrospiraceae bacterium]|nr:calcium-binding protein [Nitrospiraceae bacterium]